MFIIGFYFGKVIVIIDLEIENFYVEMVEKVI